VNLALWIVAIVAALAFAAAGTTKLTQPRDKLKQQMGWVEDFTPNTIRFIGAMEVLGALGLILPAVTGIATVLVPLAATGLAIVMILASTVHVRRGEPKVLPVNIVLFLLAAFVAVGRFAFPL
jgi:DoxX-like family